ncbi:MAG: MCP four helix bundle domain-containing protein [Clostridia bacterium]|nr:MCP four helix bundle domain-containing protein [Clostridia bacterium]
MKFLLNMKITTKLITGFIIVALLSGVVGVIGITNIGNINENGDILYQNMTVPIAEAAEMAKLFQRVRVNTRDMILEDDKDNINAMYNNISEIIEELNVLSESFEEKAISQEMKDAFSDFMDTRKTFGAMLPSFYDLCIVNDDDAAYTMIKGEMRIAADAEKDAIDQLVSMKVTDAELKAEDNNHMATQANTTMIIVISFAVIAAIGLGYYISRIISKPLNEMVGAAEKIADGDLNIKVTYVSKDEVGQLAEAFKKMSENMNDVISRISSASEQVAAGSSQLSDSSMSLSQGATEQASSIEELSASIEEIASQIKINAEGAIKAKQLAETAYSNAEEGNTQMTEMLAAMEDINESSNNISKIIKVIDDIAFQTNILALNAAVEAARAGQHGKGFAVVAEEVRNLAARSANAAKETTAMIEGSMKKVNDGTTIAKRTAEALSKIVEGVSEVTDLVGDISAASNEQSQGVDQINQGLNQISDVVQTTSATAEETAAASEELSGQSNMLKSQVATFKLKRDTNKFDYKEKVNREPHHYDEPVKPTLKNKQIDRKRIALSDDEFDKY